MPPCFQLRKRVKAWKNKFKKFPMKSSPYLIYEKRILTLDNIKNLHETMIILWDILFELWALFTQLEIKYQVLRLQFPMPPLIFNPWNVQILSITHSRKDFKIHLFSVKGNKDLMQLVRYNLWYQNHHQTSTVIPRIRKYFLFLLFYVFHKEVFLKRTSQVPV